MRLWPRRRDLPPLPVAPEPPEHITGAGTYDDQLWAQLLRQSLHSIDQPVPEWLDRLADGKEVRPAPLAQGPSDPPPIAPAANNERQNPAGSAYARPRRPRRYQETPEEHPSLRPGQLPVWVARSKVEGAVAVVSDELSRTLDPDRRERLEWINRSLRASVSYGMGEPALVRTLGRYGSLLGEQTCASLATTLDELGYAVQIYQAESGPRVTILAMEEVRRREAAYPDVWIEAVRKMSMHLEGRWVVSETLKLLNAYTQRGDVYAAALQLMHEVEDFVSKNEVPRESGYLLDDLYYAAALIWILSDHVPVVDPNMLPDAVAPIRAQYATLYDDDDEGENDDEEPHKEGEAAVRAYAGHRFGEPSSARVVIQGDAIRQVPPLSGEAEAHRQSEHR